MIIKMTDGKTNDYRELLGISMERAKIIESHLSEVLREWREYMNQMVEQNNGKSPTVRIETDYVLRNGLVVAETPEEAVYIAYHAGQFIADTKASTGGIGSHIAAMLIAALGKKKGKS